MKRFFVIAFLLIGLGSMIFIGASPRTPLGVRVTAMTNQEDGGVNIYFTVSNRTARDYCFHTYPQALSNGVWFTSVDDRETFGGVKGLQSHFTSDEVVYTFRNTGPMRLEVTGWPLKSAWPKWCSGGSKLLHLQRFLNEQQRRNVDTAPFDLPSR